MKTVISTGDKDLAQLVDDDTVLVNTMTRDGSPAVPMDAQGVLERFGVPPERIVDFLTPDRRHCRQRARRRQGRPEDRRQVAGPVRLARRTSWRTPARSAARSARTCAPRSTGCRRRANWSR